jgi:hypothetical protein
MTNGYDPGSEFHGRDENDMGISAKSIEIEQWSDLENIENLRGLFSSVFRSS